MKYLIQAIVFAVCYCLDGYLKPFFFDLGYAIGIWISSDPDLGAIIAGLIGGLQVALVYGSGFAVAKRINERRLDGSLRTAPGIRPPHAPCGYGRHGSRRRPDPIFRLRQPCCPGFWCAVSL